MSAIATGGVLATLFAKKIQTIASRLLKRLQLLLLLL